ncbi:MAG: hypothetical protein HY074_09835 [Deltaproteobacteria bacterium]|nr:hypothetical protein [Deltaproteobacteria bacterium]
MRLLLVCLFVFSSAAVTAPAPARAADVFRFRLPADPATLDWTRAATSFETYVLMNIMEGLVEIDKSLNAVHAA